MSEDLVLAAAKILARQESGTAWVDHEFSVLQDFIACAAQIVQPYADRIEHLEAQPTGLDERAEIVAWLRGNACAQREAMKTNAKFGNFEIAAKAQAAAIRDQMTADAIEALAHKRKS